MCYRSFTEVGNIKFLTSFIGLHESSLLSLSLSHVSFVDCYQWWFEAPVSFVVLGAEPRPPPRKRYHLRENPGYCCHKGTSQPLYSCFSKETKIDSEILISQRKQESKVIYFIKVKYTLFLSSALRPNIEGTYKLWQLTDKTNTNTGFYMVRQTSLRPREGGFTMKRISNLQVLSHSLFLFSQRKLTQPNCFSHS